MYTLYIVLCVIVIALSLVSFYLNELSETKIGAYILLGICIAFLVFGFGCFFTMHWFFGILAIFVFLFLGAGVLQVKEFKFKEGIITLVLAVGLIYINHAIYLEECSIYGNYSESDEMYFDNNPGTHHVDGYYRSDGTYVNGYERTNPDGVIWSSVKI